MPIIYGTQGDDTIDGTYSTPTSSADDTIKGGGGNDRIDGLGGDDSIQGGAGADTMTGGGGVDTVSYATSSAGVAVAADFGYASFVSEIPGGDSVGDVFVDAFEIVYGSGYQDYLLAAAHSATTLNGAAGDDFMKGGGASDYLDGGTGADTMRGGEGDDIYIVDNTLDEVHDDNGLGVGGTDSVFASVTYSIVDEGSIENLYLTGPGNIDGTGNSGNNSITGNAVSNRLYGYGGADTLDGGGAISGAQDRLIGGAGDDTYIVRSNNDIVDESAEGSNGVDTVQTSIAYSLENPNVLGFVENLRLTGTANVDGTGNEYDNVINGNSGKNVLYGLEGDDTFGGEGGGDTLVGGVGDDTYYVNSDDKIVETAGQGSDKLIFSFGAPTYVLAANVSIEKMMLADASTTARNLTGNNLAQTLIGNDADNILNGGGGADTMSGGNGSDTYYVDNIGDRIYEAAGPGIDTVNSTITFSLAGQSIERLKLIGTAAINGTGNELDNILTGNAAANVLNGGLGADTMAGGGNNDTYYVNDVGDRVSEAADAGVDTVHATLASYTLSANVERLYFDDTGAHVGRGNAISNLLAGNAGEDKFVIDAGGNDTFSGGSGEDSFDARSSATGVVLRLDNQAANAGAVAGDAFASIEKFFGSDTAGDAMTSGAGRAQFYGYGGNDTLTGGNAADALSGGAGNDRVIGNGGQDALDGGLGNDTLTGGADRDFFTFVDAAFGKDTVTDFQDGTDLIKVYSAVADSLGDFTIAGNGTTHVTLTLTAAPANVITLDGASAITLTAADFLFY